MSEKELAAVPFYVHEGTVDRLMSIIRKLWILTLVLVVLLVGTNLAWILYESQFETVTVEQEVDTGLGSAYVSGTGDVSVGEDKAEDYDPAEKDWE